MQDSPTPKIQNELYVTSINSVTSSMPSPNFAWKDKSGKQIIFRDLIKGKYALVNFGQLGADLAKRITRFG